MTRIVFCLFALLMTTLMTALMAAPAWADTYISLATGGINGAYFDVGGAICRLVNDRRAVHGIRCSTEGTDGSVHNLMALREKDFDFALVQSDWQSLAYTGRGPFSEQGPSTGLRSVMSLFTEPLTVLAGKDSGVETLAAVKGKRVNIGLPGSAQRTVTQSLMTAMDWSRGDFPRLLELAPSDQINALCAGRVDVLTIAVSHPNAFVREALRTCDARLIPVMGPEVTAFTRNYSAYAPTFIPAEFYRGIGGDVKTYGIRATLVTRADVSDDIVYRLVHAVFENFDRFHVMHPVLNFLDQDEMTRMALTAPLHAGARRYYREAGLLKQVQDPAPVATPADAVPDDGGDALIQEESG